MSDKVLQQLAGEIAFLKREVNRLKTKETPSATAWADWTPTITQSVSVSFTNNFSRYAVIENTVIVRASLTVTSSGTGNNSIVIGGIPENAADNSGIAGTMAILDNGTAYYVGALFISGTTFLGRAHALGSAFGVAPNFALASGDIIYLVATYER